MSSDNINPKPSIENILGLELDAGTENWKSVLSKPGEYDETSGARRPKMNIIPANAEKWVRALTGEQETDLKKLFLAQPPKDRESILAALNQNQMMARILSKTDEDILRGLDKIVPNWVHLDAFHLISFSNEGAPSFDWLARAHPEILKNEMGIIPHPDQANNWQIDRDPRPPRKSERGIDNRKHGGLEHLWKRSEDEIENLRITTGAERLIEAFDHIGTLHCRWLWDNVSELNSYIHGNELSWFTAATLSSYPLKGNVSRLGDLYMKQAALSIKENGIMVTDSPDKYLSYARQWLDVPVMRDPDMQKRLVSSKIDLREIPGLARRNTAVIDLLLDDEACANGYVHLLNKVGTGLMSWPKSKSDWYEALGSEPEEFQAKANGSGGLVQAAMIVGSGSVLERLFRNAKGVKLIQQVLSGPMSARCLARMGEESSWSALGDMVLARPNDWEDWRDKNGNTISHWLAYGSNKVEKSQDIKTNMELAKTFINHMSISNHLGNEPVIWMPREHADIITRKILRNKGNEINPEDHTQGKPKDARPAPRNRRL